MLPRLINNNSLFYAPIVQSYLSRPVWVRIAVALFCFGFMAFLTAEFFRVNASWATKVNLSFLVLSPFAALVWFQLLLSRKFLYALVGLIIVLPIISKADDFPTVEYFRSPDGVFVQVITLTSALIFIFALRVLLTVDHPKNPLRDRMFVMLLFYAVAGSVSQFANHSFTTAILFSIGAYWQWIALWFIVTNSAKSPISVVLVMRGIVLALLLGIPFRFVFTARFFFETDASGAFVREGGAGFGPPLFYAGYLLLGIILALFLARYTRSRLEMFLWGGATILLTVEMLNTLTRGAVLALGFVLLVLILYEWRRVGLILVALILITLPATNVIVDQVFNDSRALPLDLDIFKERHVQDRYQLAKIVIPRSFDRGGLGYGISNTQLFEVDGRLLTSHNVFLNVSQSSGGFAMLGLIGLFLVAGIRLVKTYRSSSGPSKTIVVYLGMAIVAWLIHANTSSQTVTWLVPFEAIFLIFLVLFLVPALDNSSESNHELSATQKPHGNQR